MKLILLAAAAMIAVPALAQTGTTTPDPQTSQPGADTSSQTPPSQTPDAQTSPAPTDGSAPMATPPAGQQPMTAPSDGSTPAGGYAPSTAPTGAQPGGTVRFQAAPSPDQAYPAPAPLANYPTCKPGQFDKCMQGSGSTHSRAVRHRRSR